MNPDYMVKLAEGVYLIQAPNQSRFPHCNAFFFTGKENILIDTGIGEGYWDLLGRKNRGTC